METPWQRLKKFTNRLLLLAAVWWLLAGAEGRSWLFGGPVMLMIAAWGSRKGVWQLMSERPQECRAEKVPDPFSARWRPWRLLHFVPFFVWRSLMGSCDVAWRALHRRLPIAPVLLDYAPCLPADSPARVFFANCISLFPGTLTAAWADNVLRIHVLTESRRVTPELQELERQVALLFGHPWRDRLKDVGA